MAQRSLLLLRLLAGIGQLLLDAPCQFVLALRCDERVVARRFEASPSRPTDSGRFSPTGRAAGRKKKA
jgi:hypothetical protein